MKWEWKVITNRGGNSPLFSITSSKMFESPTPLICLCSCLIKGYISVDFSPNFIKQNECKPINQYYISDIQKIKGDLQLDL